MSNHRYNGDPNQYLGGHSLSPHLAQQHGHHPHIGNSSAMNGHTHAHVHAHAHAQAHSPSALMDTGVDNGHPRPAYSTAAVTNHSHNHGHSAFSYPNQNHPISSHNHPHNLVHASSSSLSTLSPSLSTAARPSSSNSANNNLRPIAVHDHDVLSGRGVNIAQHPGNQRFRTLITTFRDQEYCTTYSAGEKRAVALQIIKHIKDLEPPGRFLKRDGRGQGSRGLSGPWDELSDRESIKKTCQALRDCNRQDRQGYAKGVSAPGDVMKVVQEVSHIPAKERAAAAAHAIATEATTNALNAISVAASTNSCTVARASDMGNDASSSISVTSSTKRSREEANSSSNAVAELVESGANGTYSSPSSYYNAQQYHTSDHMNRFAPNAAANTAMSNSNYHVTGPPAMHYQQHPYSNVQQQTFHHNPHLHNPSQYRMSNTTNSAAGGFPSPASVGAQSYYPAYSMNNNNNSNVADSLMPMATAQAPTAYQDAMTSSKNNNGHTHLQHHNNYYHHPDPYSGNHSHLQNPSLLMHDHQVIKKQRTEDTDPSTGPSEPSPINGSSLTAATNDSQNDNNGMVQGLTHAIAKVEPFEVNTASAPPPTGSNMSIETHHHNNINTPLPCEMQPGDDVPLFHDVVECDDGGANNDVSSWATEQNNSSSMDNPENFQDTLGF